MNLKDLKENKSYHIVGGIIAIYIVGAVIFYFIAIAPKISAVKELKAQIAEKRSLLSKAGSVETQEEKIEKTKVRIKELEENISYYEKKLPTEKDIPDILQYLSNIADKTDVKLLEIEKKQEIMLEQEQALYVTVPFKLILKGGYHNIGSFVNRLENAERFMKIDQLEVEADKKSPFEHRSEMMVHTYILDAREPKKE